MSITIMKMVQHFHMVPAGVFLLFALAFCLTFACSTRKTTEYTLHDHLSVSWELLENTFGLNEQCKAAFTFSNMGDTPIGSKNWRIYFNQKTLKPLPTADSSKGWVEHINGDFYRFVPGDKFLLPPEDSLTIEYLYQGIMIKEGDAPAGAYWALDEGNEHPRLIPLKNLTIKPFIMNEKIFPGFNTMLPTPEHEYIQNALIRKLPDDKLGHLIPTPVQYTPNRGQVVISNAMTILYAKELENEANYLTKTFAAQFGVNLNKRLGSSDVSPSIILRISDVKVNGISNEAYHLQISPDKGILITGSDPAGVFYGIISLLALTEVEANSLPAIQAADIIDAPRFHFRGLLLDVSRNFQKKEAVLKLIDLLAFYKINILNLRLTEDEGWRIEIKGLPELTNIGARRGHTLNDADCLPPSFGSGPFPNAAESYGNGYYSREDFKEILLHAHHRHIQIVPEICFPSHARAAIKSMEARYRHYVEQGDITAAEEFRLIDPLDRSVFESAQLYKDNIACVALNSTCHFYKTVVQDIREMYHEVGLELSFLHSGGDEVPRNAWTRSPECQKLIEDHPEIGGMRNLQAWFFNRLLLTLAEYDLQVGGWEEVVLTRDSLDAFSINKQFLSRQVIPYVWNNTGDNLDLGYRIANAGYSIVMCNVTNLYFDLSYNADPREPGLYWGGFQDAKDPFLLAPFDVFKTAMYDDFGNLLAKELPFERLQTLEPTHRKNILGLQAQLWTETVKGQAMMEYYILPKLFAFAEKAWASAPAWESDPDLRRRTKKIDDDWNEFANRIGQREFPRLDHLFGGFNYRIPMPGAVIENGWLKANIAYPGLTIRYTLDGSQPTMDSPITTQPMQVHTPVKLAAFSAAGRRGWIAEIK